MKRGRRPKSNPSGLQLIDSQFKTFGMLEKCQECSEKCKEYAAPNLKIHICKMSPDYQKMAEAFDC